MTQNSSEDKIKKNCPIAGTFIPLAGSTNEAKPKPDCIAIICPAKVKVFTTIMVTKPNIIPIIVC